MPVIRRRPRGRQGTSLAYMPAVVPDIGCPPPQARLNKIRCYFRLPSAKHKHIPRQGERNKRQERGESEGLGRYSMPCHAHTHVFSS